MSLIHTKSFGFAKSKALFGHMAVTRARVMELQSLDPDHAPSPAQRAA